MTQKKSGMVNAVEESLVSYRRVRRPERHHRRSRRKIRDVKVLKEVKDGGGEDEKAQVERKIVALQSIVPGGESLGIDKLFEETAGYILALQNQLQALRALTICFEGWERERMKLGG
ncbi:unnamed protein product [Ilex paraguariensis]